MSRLVVLSLFVASTAFASENQPKPVWIAVPVNGHITELKSKQWLVSLWDRTFVFDPATSQATPFGDGRVHGLIPIVQTPKGTFVSGAGIRSTDNGKTWQTIAGFPDIKSQGWRHEMTCLENGWLLASEIRGHAGKLGRAVPMSTHASAIAFPSASVIRPCSVPVPNVRASNDREISQSIRIVTVIGF